MVISKPLLMGVPAMSSVLSSVENRPALPETPPTHGTRAPAAFDPLSIEPQNLALLSRLDKTAPTRIPTIPPLDLDRSKSLARLIGAPDVPKDVKEGARAMLRRSVDLLVRILASSKARRHPTLRFDDLVQEGEMGILRAIEKYDAESPDYRAPFGTYACYWILNRMSRYIDSMISGIRRPVHVQEQIRRIGKMTALLGQQLGRVPSDEELSAALDLPIEQIRKAMKAKEIGLTYSLDQPISADSATTLYHFQSSPEKSPEKAALETGEKYRLQEAMTFLTKRQREVIQLRVGWKDHSDQSLETIGARYDLTRERVRQIEADAKARLKEILTLFNERHCYDELFRRKQEEQFALQAFAERDRIFLSHEYSDIPTPRLVPKGLKRKEQRRLTALRTAFPKYLEIVHELGIEAVGAPENLHAYYQHILLLENSPGHSQTLAPELLRSDPALRRLVDAWIKKLASKREQT